MSEPSPDPLDALRAALVPMQPDPTFAADLRARLVLASTPSVSTRSVSTRSVSTRSDSTPEELPMSNDLSVRPRNGVRHGDVSYITVGLADLARGRAFYAAVLGWQFSPGASEHGVQVADVVPMVGLWDGEPPAGGTEPTTALAYRVDDIVAAVAAVRALGGVVSDPDQEPYALAAEGHDDQGIPFYLHEMPAADGADAPPENGDVEGDVSYLTMVVPDIDAARAFYGGVLGWTFGGDGGQVGGVAPMMGMTTQPEAGPAAPGVILCYRVDDIAAAVERTRAAGGDTGEVVQRPYGLEALCSDDQGTPFYLHQF